MSARSDWDSEEALASAVSQWLAEQGWEPYHEVCEHGGARRADIVATKGPLLWVVEAKLTFGLGVVAQALGWVGMAHFISVAVPLGTTRRGKGKGLLHEIAVERGIGVIQVPAPSTVERGDVRWPRPNTDSDDAPLMDYSHWRVAGPRLDRRARVDSLRGLLQPEHKAARPGSKAKFFTPFLATCRDVVEHVTAAGGRAGVKETMTAIAHHYASDQSARSSMVAAVRRGLVEGLDVVEDGRRLVFALRAAGEASRGS